MGQKYRVVAKKSMCGQHAQFAQHLKEVYFSCPNPPRNAVSWRLIHRALGMKLEGAIELVGKL